MMMSFRLVFVGLSTVLIARHASAQVVWGTCSALPTPIADVACAPFSVPRDWFDPSNPSFSNMTLQVVRYTTAQSVGTKVVWLFGEGCSLWSDQTANSVSNWAQQMATAGFTVYAPDLRGSGFSSSPLSCSDDPYSTYTWPSTTCATKLQASQLSVYTLTQACYDVAIMIRSINSVAPNTTQNFAVGDSFGTLWLQECLGLFPDLPIAKIGLSSPAAPNAYDVFGSMAGFTSGARYVMSVCQSDPICSGQIGGGTVDPLRFLDAVFMQKADQCLQPIFTSLKTTVGPSGSVDLPRSIQDLIAYTLGQPDVLSLPLDHLPAFIPALLFRANRCNASVDVPALTTFVKAIILGLRSISAGQNGLQSTRPVCAPSNVVVTNILFNEYVSNNVGNSVNDMLTWPIPPPTFTRESLSALYGAWPKYNTQSGTSAVAQSHGYSNRAVPAMLVVGALDVASPPYNAYFASLWYPGQSINVVPNRGHRIMRDAAVVAGSNLTYGGCLASAFAAYFNGAGTPSCFMTMLSTLPDVTGSSQAWAPLRQLYFGAADSWQYVRPSASTAPILPNVPPGPTNSITITVNGRTIGIIIGVVFAIALVAVIVVCVRRRLKPADPFAHLREGSPQPGVGGVNFNRQSVASYSSVPGPQGGGQPSWR